MTLPAVQFLRRFLLHVLPKGFVRLRYYGLLANRGRKDNIALCRQLLSEKRPTDPTDAIIPEPSPSTPTASESAPRQPRPCPFCKQGHLQYIRELKPNEPLPIQHQPALASCNTS
jgi:hypothetical protein